MRRTTWGLAALILVGAAALPTRPARAQNTYADVPFNQGSLFYRPSGARPPQTTPRRTYTAPRYVYPPRYPAATNYYTPRPVRPAYRYGFRRYR